MCQIIYSPSGIIPANLDAQCEAEARKNSDGVGIMHVDQAGGIVAYKSEKSSDYPSMLRIIRGLPKDTAWAIHFRYGTSGLKNKENAHPHSVGDGHWMMHNGVFNIDEPKGEQSDTAILASAMRGYPTRSKQAFLKEFWDRYGWASRVLVAGPAGWYYHGQWQHYTDCKGVYSSCGLAYVYSGKPYSGYHGGSCATGYYGDDDTGRLPFKTWAERQKENREATKVKIAQSNKVADAVVDWDDSEENDITRTDLEAINDDPPEGIWEDGLWNILETVQSQVKDGITSKSSDSEIVRWVQKYPHRAAKVFREVFKQLSY